ncbi:unnamed protein product [Owenia fusiformis]|uniref:Protein disulfide-isomerase n=1 Tax=Owenia fusiformis TaxID=6347 RepID=A0A8J1TUQ3_OWEFU|nr:unnamed protein product [Owenia fusiformis]
MQKFIVFAALVAVTFASDVIDLTDSNFDSVVNGEDIILVEFFAPWCGHCKRLAPEYETAATALKKNDPPVALAKIDCVGDGKDKCQQYGVSGYPTLKIFKNGEVSAPYEGPRESAGIIGYMRKKAGPVTKVLNSVENAKNFVTKDDADDNAVVVGFFESADSDGAKTFKKLADALSEDFMFGVSTDSAINKEFKQKDSVVIFRPKRLQNKMEGATAEFDGDVSSLTDLKTFVNNNINGLVGHRTQGNQEQFQKPLIVAYYEVDYKRNTKGTNYWRNRVMKVGKKITEGGAKVFFAVSSATEFSQEIDEFSLNFESNPVVGAWNTKGQKFVMTDDFSMDTFEKFVNDFLDNKLEPHMKSEAIPDNSENAVKVAVGKNFADLVDDETKDVLIEFYAPWCGHCKSLEPKYNELAEKLAKEESIVIAKMDATANDVPPQYNVKGFPTIYFAPKGNKQNPKQYNGGREVDDFVKYLAAEATEELSGFTRKGKAKKAEL